MPTMKTTHLLLLSMIMFQICHSGVIFVSQDEGPLKGKKKNSKKN